MRFELRVFNDPVKYFDIIFYKSEDDPGTMCSFSLVDFDGEVDSLISVMECLQGGINILLEGIDRNIKVG